MHGSVIESVLDLFACGPVFNCENSVHHAVKSVERKREEEVADSQSVCSVLVCDVFENVGNDHENETYFEEYDLSFLEPAIIDWSHFIVEQVINHCERYVNQKTKHRFKSIILNH